MPVQKKIPMRMCAVCRQQFPKRSLIRLVKAQDGQISIDDTGKKPGRGLYVCPSGDCLALATKGPRLEKAAGGKIDETVLAALREKAENGS